MTVAAPGPLGAQAHARHCEPGLAGSGLMLDDDRHAGDLLSDAVRQSHRLTQLLLQR
jgi:hypothetical protein